MQQARVNCRHLLLFDGSCGLCSGLVQYVLKFGRQAAFCFASLQSELAARLLPKAGCSQHHLETFVVIANFRESSREKHTKARAGLFVLSCLGWPWKLALLLRLLPPRLLDSVYGFIARNRSRIRRRPQRCRLPGPEFENRLPGVCQDTCLESEETR